MRARDLVQLRRSCRLPTAPQHRGPSASASASSAGRGPHPTPRYRGPTSSVVPPAREPRESPDRREACPPPPPRRQQAKSTPQERTLVSHSPLRSRSCWIPTPPSLRLPHGSRRKARRRRRPRPQRQHWVRERSAGGEPKGMSVPGYRREATAQTWSYTNSNWHQGSFMRWPAPSLLFPLLC
ncbi:hypothetical protein PVAP13_4KG194000 [Panicum virgatum]|uniref:Uncharacterized protein n=1 Tax=Panicum virgatum TaxID=38727 RepID=A0A8T0TNC2_PANVG|nr:hypothetical protein PVAP13_4KG194000 [Panicum virgatum]